MAIVASAIGSETESEPSGKSRAEESVVMQVDANPGAFLEHYYSQPAHERPPFSSILAQLSGEQSMALCRELFFPREYDDNDRMETMERERTSQYASKPATMQHWRESVQI